MKRIKKFIGITLIVLLLTGIAAGCGQTDNSTPSNQDNNSSQQEEKTNITLYFSDKDALTLVAENREVAKGSKSMEQIIIEELIAGPENPEHLRTVPAETKLLSVEVKEGTVFIDFSEEFITKHWGGSTGESFTVYSIVNSLTELPDLKSVQFLVNCKKIETLAGHMDLSVPIERNEMLIKK